MIFSNISGIKNITFSLSPHQKFEKIINITLPKHFLAGYYGGEIYIDSYVDYHYPLNIYVPIKYVVNFYSVENKKIKVFDLIPEYINFSMYLDNYNNFKILIYSDSSGNIKFKCEDDNKYDEYTLQTLNLGDFVKCSMKITMPDNVEKVFKKSIYIKDSLGNINKVYFLVDEKRAIELVPEKYVYPSIPSEDNKLTFYIKNNANRSILVIPQIVGFGTLGVNTSWFELPDTMTVEGNTTKYIEILYNTGDMLGIRLGEFTFLASLKTAIWSIFIPKFNLILLFRSGTFN
jgi:hypothetical protein